MMHTRFGIDEVYFHAGFTPSLLEKLNQRSELSLDGEDKIVQRLVSHDMILIFYKRIPSPSVIYRFLESLDRDPDYINSNTLLNEEELFAAIKSKTYVLITHKILVNPQG